VLLLLWLTAKPRWAHLHHPCAEPSVLEVLRQLGIVC
jgi:hypothetical protein